MLHIKTLAETIFELTQQTHDSDTLTRLSEMAWSLKPLIEAADSGVDPEVGELLWYYIGLQRDAPPSMARSYVERISKRLGSK